MRFVVMTILRVVGVSIFALSALYSNVLAQTEQTTPLRIDTLTIEQTINDVIRHNDRLTAAQFMQQAAEKKAASMSGWPDPMLMFGIENAPTNFDLDMDDMTMPMIGISQTIPYSGQSGLEKRAAKAEAAAALFDQQRMQVDMVLAARMAYAEFYYRSAILTDIGIQYDLLDMVIASAKSKLTTNQGTQAEVLAAQAEQWRMQTELYEADHMVDESRHMLNIMRGAEVDAVIAVPVPPSTITIPERPDEWIALAYSNTVQLQQLSRKSESYALSSSAARRMNWPMFGVSASYGFRSGYSTDHTGLSTERDDMISLQASVSVPIFWRGRNNRMAESMKAMQSSTDAEAVLLRKEIESKVRLMHLMVLHLQESVKLYANNIIPADQDAFQSALAGYTANRMSFTELLEYVQTIYKDRRMLSQFSSQFAQVSAEIQSYIEAPTLFTPTESAKK
jgi:outer membrane protein TolC